MPTAQPSSALATQAGSGRGGPQGKSEGLSVEEGSDGCIPYAPGSVKEQTPRSWPKPSSIISWNMEILAR